MFNAANVTFNGEEPPKVEDAGQAIAKKGKLKKKTKKSEKCNNCQDKSRSHLLITKDHTTANRTNKE